MRELLINRIEELSSTYGKVRLDPKCSRWSNLIFNGVHISKLNFHELSDEILLNVYERFIRQCQKQM
jgi:hypothetical protein